MQMTSQHLHQQKLCQSHCSGVLTCQPLLQMHSRLLSLQVPWLEHVSLGPEQYEQGTSPLQLPSEAGLVPPQKEFATCRTVNNPSSRNQCQAMGSRKKSKCNNGNCLLVDLPLHKQKVGSQNTIGKRLEACLHAAANVLIKQKQCHAKRKEETLLQPHQGWRAARGVANASDVPRHRRNNIPRHAGCRALAPI